MLRPPGPFSGQACARAPVLPCFFLGALLSARALPHERRLFPPCLLGCVRRPLHEQVPECPGPAATKQGLVRPGKEPPQHLFRSRRSGSIHFWWPNFCRRGHAWHGQPGSALHILPTSCPATFSPTLLLRADGPPRSSAAVADGGRSSIRQDWLPPTLRTGYFVAGLGYVFGHLFWPPGICLDLPLSGTSVLSSLSEGLYI